MGISACRPEETNERSMKHIKLVVLFAFCWFGAQTIYCDNNILRNQIKSGSLQVHLKKEGNKVNTSDNNEDGPYSPSEPLKCLEASLENSQVSSPRPSSHYSYFSYLMSFLPVII